VYEAGLVEHRVHAPGQLAVPVEIAVIHGVTRAVDRERFGRQRGRSRPPARLDHAR
jgi:hypothetical protein